MTTPPPNHRYFSTFWNIQPISQSPSWLLSSSDLPLRSPSLLPTQREEQRQDLPLAALGPCWERNRERPCWNHTNRNSHCLLWRAEIPCAEEERRGRVLLHGQERGGAGQVQLAAHGSLWVFHLSHLALLTLVLVLDHTSISASLSRVLLLYTDKLNYIY